MDSLEPIRKRLLADSDLCVMCGMCLPTCPTFRLTGREAESPRGRIALLRAVAAGQLEADPALTAHVDGCLGCRACEVACPSGVPYRHVLAAGRRLLAEASHAPAPPKPPSGAAGRELLRLAHAGGMIGALRHLGRGITGRTLSLLPDSRPATAPRLSGSGSAGEVLLFTGCTGESLDGDTVRAAYTLLPALGFRVRRVRGCCGALAHNAGDGSGFRRHAQTAIETFRGDQPVIVLASGCSAMLRDYPAWLEGNEATSLPPRIHELGEFLAAADWSGVEFAPLEQPVAVHIPCSQRAAGESGVAQKLLSHIPGLQPVELSGGFGCCGAGGRQMVDRPEQADALLEPLLEAIRATGAATLVSSNIGCALHMAAGLRRSGQRLDVLHPAALLARQLRG